MQQQVKNNASAILREDAIYRKQQAKDVQLLRAYEEELRDPTEFYLWQKEMRDRDAVEKLEKVAPKSFFSDKSQNLMYHISNTEN